MLVLDYIRFRMRTPHAVSFLGLAAYLRYRSITNMQQPWGWKDPRNTYTLPIWLDVFPHAKVVHVYRHGVDVAHSLRVRQNKRIATARARFSRLKPVYVFYSKRGGFSETLRCKTLEGGLSLWEEYMAEARTHVRSLGERAVEVKYEDFLAEPLAVLRTLAQFCGLDVSDAKLAAAAGQVEKGRAFTYRTDPALKAFADGAAGRLGKYGY